MAITAFCAGLALGVAPRGGLLMWAVAVVLVGLFLRVFFRATR